MPEFPLWIHLAQEILRTKDVTLAVEVGSGVSQRGGLSPSRRNLRHWLGIPGHKNSYLLDGVKCSCEGWSCYSHLITMRKTSLRKKLMHGEER